MHQTLYRPRQGRVLGGVVIGLANYFGLDPLWLRLIWLILGGLGGSGFMIYLLLWLIIPSE